jgi:hypothetical protein
MLHGITSFYPARQKERVKRPLLNTTGFFFAVVQQIGLN